MKIGNIDFVAWTMTSDASSDIAAVITHTHEYDGKNHSITELLYDDESGISEEDVKKFLAGSGMDWTECEEPSNIDIDAYAQELCERKGLMLISYDELERLEQLSKEKGVCCHADIAACHPKKNPLLHHCGL